MNFALALILLLLSPTPSDTTKALAFSDPAWKLDGEATRIEREGDREVLRMETGEAARPDIRMEDGTRRHRSRTRA